MRRLLVIQTAPESGRDPVLSTLIERQAADPRLEVRITDLSRPNPDYGALLRQIFEADSVQVY